MTAGIDFHHNAIIYCIMMKGDARITVSIPSSAHQRLIALADQSGVSISWVVRYAIDEFLHQNGDNQQMALPLARQRRGGQ